MKSHPTVTKTNGRPLWVGLAVKYLLRYRQRMMAGLFLGILYAAFSGTLVFTTKALVSRLAPPDAPPAVEERSRTESTATTTSLRDWKSAAGRWKDTALEKLDGWLPRAGRPLDWKQYTGGLLILPLLAVIRGSLSYLGAYCLRWAAERIMGDLQHEMMGRIQSLSLDYFNTTKRSEILERIKVDTRQLYLCLQMSLSDVIKEPLTLIAMLAALVWIDARLTLAIAVFLPLCAIPTIILGRKIRRAKKESRKARVAQTGVLLEALQNIRAVKAFSLEQNQLEEFRHFNQRSIMFNMRSMRADELNNPIIEVYAMCGITAILFYMLATSFPVADLAGFITALVLAFGPIKKLGGIHLRFQAARVSLDRLQDTLQLKPTVRESANALTPARFHGTIRFDDVSFAYGETTVLKNISLEIPFGQRVGIVGPSGSGKSTLINLVARFYDASSGSVRLDGHDVRDVSTGWLRNQMAIVGQEVLLFNRSVMENIRMGREDATDAEVLEAARLAEADDFIRAMPRGYDTVIGEQGVMLSGGQRQRICIARALVRRSPILILDEATASLDSRIEAAIQGHIDTLARDHTVLCVAHRLGTLKGCDRILVLRDGEMVEDGTFEELLRKNGLFAALAIQQGIAKV